MDELSLILWVGARLFVCVTIVLAILLLLVELAIELDDDR